MLKKIIMLNLVLFCVVVLAILIGTENTKAAEQDDETAVIEIKLSGSNDKQESTVDSVPVESVDPVVVIYQYEQNCCDIEYLARSVYHSPLRSVYEKFKYMNAVYNQKKSDLKNDDGTRVYGATIQLIVTNRHEYPWWSDKMPTTEAGKKLMTYDMRLARLFLDYITTCEVLQVDPFIDCSGTVISFTKDANGENRYVDIYKRDGSIVIPALTPEQFDNLIINQFGKEYKLDVG